MKHANSCHATAWIGAALVLSSACSDDAPVRVVDSSREVAVASADVRLNATSDQRFGVGPSRPAAEPAHSSASPFAWDVPQGWTELPTSTMRTANFRVAGDERAECYLTLLSGEAGGLGANVNRWRTQMSQPAANEDAIAALPRVPFLGQEAVLVDIAGPFTGMSGGPQPNFRLVGLLLVDPAGSAFLKMTGPAEVVSKEVDAFHALARSFRTRGESAPHAAASHPPSPPTPPSTDSAGGIRWTAPRGWQRAPERATRTVSFFIDTEQSVECYVTILGGDAGGALANVNRWRGQMAQPPISDDELAALLRIPMLGNQAILAEIDHAETDASTQMLAAVGELSGRSVFVKVSGPRELIQSQREAFIAFCGSIAPAQ
jgi:hypothetical protein